MGIDNDKWMLNLSNEDQVAAVLDKALNDRESLKPKSIDFKHSDLVDLGGKYLRYKQNCQIVVQEPVTWHGIRPDIMGYQSTADFMIEVKVSRSDFFADRKKKHYGDILGNAQYYLVPENLIKPEEVPESYGLLYAQDSKWKNIIEIKSAPWHRCGGNDNLKAMILYGIMTKERCTGRFNSKGKI